MARGSWCRAMDCTLPCPYIYQCPIPAKSGNLAIVPSMVETAVGLQLYQEHMAENEKQGTDQGNSGDGGSVRRAEMMMYSCSPSTAIPATYPMLEPDPDLWDNGLIEPGSNDDLANMGLSGSALEEAKKLQQRVRALGEDGRRFSRVALDPLLCYRGTGAQGGSTASLEGETSREREEDLGLLAKELEEQLDSCEAKEKNSTDEKKNHTMRSKAADEEKEGGKMSTRKYLIGNPVKMLTSPYINVDKMAKTEQGRQRLMAMRERDNMIAEALDELSPALADGHSETLQEKAFRAVFSVGFDAMVVDAESSAHCGKLSLGPAAMLSSSKTDGIFGSFEVPEGFS